MNETQKILDALARMETKIDFHKAALDEYDSRISSLERKFWTSIGAAVLSIGAYLKSLFS